ncbi:MAG: hypothetical protein ACRDRX_18035, partial [Pseudonocardiaceae bacterium]
RQASAVARSGFGKLWNTGVAYMQHVKFVDNAYTLPRRDVPDALAEYLGGLSDTARAGFVLTLALLARGARGDPNRRDFIQALTAAVSGSGAPDAITSTAPPRVAAPVERPAPPARATSTFDENLATVHAWFPLTDDQRRQVIRAHLESLSAEEREVFVEHARQMAENIAGQIADHDAEEDRSWGGFIEDRMSYNLAKLRTGQSDSRWVEARSELVAFARLIHMANEIAG